MFKEVFGNMFNYDDDYLMAMGLGLFCEGLKKKDEVKVKEAKPRKSNSEGRRIFDQMKEQAEDVEYEDIPNKNE